MLSAYVIMEAVGAGASAAVLMRMVANLGLDVMFSAVPLVGDLLDFGFKSNTRNFALLQKHLADPAGAKSTSRVFLILLGLVVLTLIVVTILLGIMAIRWVASLVG